MERKQRQCITIRRRFFAVPNATQTDKKRVILLLRRRRKQLRFGTTAWSRFYTASSAVRTLPLRAFRLAIECLGSRFCRLFASLFLATGSLVFRSLDKFYPISAQTRPWRIASGEALSLPAGSVLEFLECTLALYLDNHDYSSSCYHTSVGDC